MFVPSKERKKRKKEFKLFSRSCNLRNDIDTGNGSSSEICFSLMTEKPQRRERSLVCRQWERTTRLISQNFDHKPQSLRSSGIFFSSSSYKFRLDVDVDHRCNENKTEGKKERRRNDFEWSCLFLLFTTCVFDSYRTATREKERLATDIPLSP